MRNWTDRFRDGGGSGTGQLVGYSVDLSFRISDVDDQIVRRRRVALVTEALREIERRDDRLRRWAIGPSSDPTWIHIQAVVEAAQPGQVAELSEEWMRSAISAANLATDPADGTIPVQREVGWGIRALPSVTAQVLADV